MDKEKLVRKISESSKKKHKIIGFSLSILLLLYLLFSDYGLIKRFSLLFEKSELEQRISDNLNDIENLKEQKKRLETDSTEIEKTAREKYGYVKENETIYIIKDDE